jgi:hypothetical protein
MMGRAMGIHGRPFDFGRITLVICGVFSRLGG